MSMSPTTFNREPSFLRPGQRGLLLSKSRKQPTARAVSTGKVRISPVPSDSRLTYMIPRDKRTTC